MNPADILRPTSPVALSRAREGLYIFRHLHEPLTAVHTSTDSHPFVGDVSIRILSDFPWCRLSTRQRTWHYLILFFFQNHKQMVSSAASQIEASVWKFLSLNWILGFTNVSSLAGGDNLRTTIIKNGVPTNVPNYGAVCQPFLRYYQNTCSDDDLKASYH